MGATPSIFVKRSVRVAGIAMGLVAAIALMPINGFAADLRELLEEQRAEEEQQLVQAEQTPAQEEQPPQQPQAQPQERDGFLNSLSDFLGGPDERGVNRDAGNGAAKNGDDYVDEWADEAEFGDDAQHYDGQGVAPEQSDMFDDAFGPDTVRAGPADENGPAADGAPELFRQGGRVETESLDAPEGLGDLDIFGRPRKKADDAAQGDAASKFDLSDLPPVDFRVSKNATVTVRALDKITARMSEHKLKVNKPYMFGTLAIVMRTCVKSPPEETPEVKAFLQIADSRPEMDNKPWFSGWMFASSPAISALEHPVYDVWVIDCNIISASADDDN